MKRVWMLSSGDMAKLVEDYFKGSAPETRKNFIKAVKPIIQKYEEPKS